MLSHINFIVTLDVTSKLCLTKTIHVKKLRVLSWRGVKKSYANMLGRRI